VHGNLCITASTEIHDVIYQEGQSTQYHTVTVPPSVGYCTVVDHALTHLP